MTYVRQSIDSPLGPLVTVAGPDGICLLEFGEPDRLDAQMAAVRRWFRSDAVPGDSPHLDQLRKELDAYFAGALRRFTVPVVMPGTPFQQRVWSELRCIPYGETRSYEDVARAVGTVSAPRAVGRANGSNRIAIVVPCHRVVNKDGALGGYGGQLWRKEALLRLERPSLFRGREG
jgi:AraC family transcriptional regulator of adaptative response/methylated-DNA-[protein]-cysteine methyltransferase